MAGFHGPPCWMTSLGPTEKVLCIVLGPTMAGSQGLLAGADQLGACRGSGVHFAQTDPLGKN